MQLLHSLTLQQVTTTVQNFMMWLIIDLALVLSLSLPLPPLPLFRRKTILPQNINLLHMLLLITKKLEYKQLIWSSVVCSHCRSFWNQWNYLWKCLFPNEFKQTQYEVQTTIITRRRKLCWKNAEFWICNLERPPCPGQVRAAIERNRRVITTTTSFSTNRDQHTSQVEPSNNGSAI